MTSSPPPATDDEATGRPRRLLRERLVYVHVPKCGGTSVSSALAPLFEGPRSLGVGGTRKVHAIRSARASAILAGRDPSDPYDWEAVHALRDRILAYQLADPGNRFVWGHVRFRRATRLALGEEVRWVTVLRHPVERFLSEYFFNVHKEVGHVRVRIGLEDFVETPAAREYAEKFLTYFAGGPFGDRSPEAVERAVENLALFDVVGFLDRPGSFEEAFEARFGVRPELGHRNRNPAPKEAAGTVTPELRARITELCGPDIEVYERALERADAVATHASRSE